MRSVIVSEREPRCRSSPEETRPMFVQRVAIALVALVFGGACATVKEIELNQVPPGESTAARVGAFRRDGV